MESNKENKPTLKDGRKLNALIVGGSGAVGRELVDYLVDNENYESITVISRRTISRWDNYNQSQLSKFIFIQLEDLDLIFDLEKYPKGYKEIIPDKKYDTLFSCLGGRSKSPDFRKVDFEYVKATAKIAELMKIHHFSIVSSIGASSTSWFNYLKVKGEGDDEVMKVDIPCISILRPGKILERDNDERSELSKYIPFLSKITSKNVGLGMMNIDITVHEKKVKQKKIWEHKDIEEMANQQPGGCC